MTSPVINLRAPLVTVKDKNGKEIGQGYVIDPWNSFFQQFTQQAPEVQAITVTGSPFSYQPNDKGKIIISGGTVSAIVLVRGSTAIPLSTTRPLILPATIGDMVMITYSIAPTVQFLGD